MSMFMKNSYTAIALFSGGLDSILAAKTIEEQGLKVKCLHFISPFFGKPHLVQYWQKTYNLDIDIVDISAEFVQMLCNQPQHGFGKLLNPCVDCKVLLMQQAKISMQKYNVSIVISGEVLGQRPMSQRRDTLNIIQRDSGLKDMLLRPLSAKFLKPSQAELSGIVDREKLHSISGRGRKQQLELAKYFNMTDIPTPAGGCMLAEQENASRYLMVLTRVQSPTPQDFTLAHTGRQYWDQDGNGQRWLIIGRNAASNQALQELISDQDYVFRLRDFTGPLAIGRYAKNWDITTIEDAASFMASYAPKAVKAYNDDSEQIAVVLKQGKQGQESIIHINPKRQTALNWHEPLWENVKKLK